MNTNRRLTRNRADGIIAGVCAGLADYFGWEHSTMRIVYILVSILSAAFPGILVYIILWIFMPRN